MPYTSASTNEDHSSYFQVDRDILKVLFGGVHGTRARSWRAHALSENAKKYFGRNFERIDDQTALEISDA